MSIAVPLPELAAAIAEHGSVGYLLSVGDDGRPRANHLTFAAQGGVVRAGIGGRTAANVAARPAVSLLFPPNTPDGMSLIVDGDATVTQPAEGDAGVGTVVIAATWAVRHRPAPPT